MKRPDFNSLYRFALQSIESTGNMRAKNILINHNGDREYICRKLGIISNADILRITNRLKSGGSV